MPKIDETFKAMEDLNEQRATKLNAMKASGQQVATLEPRRAEAEKYLATEAQLKGKQSALYQKNIGAAKAASASTAPRFPRRRPPCPQSVRQLSLRRGSTPTVVPTSKTHA